MDIKKVRLPSNRKFGYFFTTVFFLSGLYFWTEGAANLSYIFFSLCFIFLLVTRFKASFLSPLNKLWMRLGLLLGMIMSPIVMGIIFFGLFTPVSLVMRLLGRDELKLKPKPCQSSWRLVEEPRSDLQSFKNQF